MKAFGARGIFSVLVLCLRPGGRNSELVGTSGIDNEPNPGAVYLSVKLIALVGMTRQLTKLTESRCNWPIGCHI